MRLASKCVALLAVTATSACQSDTPPGQTYFDRVIAPILDQSCSRGSSGCHAADPGDPNAFAAGNLDLTSYANIQKRKDVLRTHGAYPVPFLLAKAVGETDDLKIVYRTEDQKLSLLIPHAGGKVFTVGSQAYLTLLQWTSNGAREDGVKQPPAPEVGVGDCSTGVPADFDEAALTATTQWQDHQGEFDAVQQILTAGTCNAGNCHGAEQSDFHLTCGTDATQRAFNFRQLWAFVGDPVERSDILWRPSAGGAQHTGGVHFSGPEDPKYLTMKAFATAVGPYAPARSGPQQFFEDRVMPVLLSRGCAAEGCHSPAAMNDFKMRAGSPGFFSALSLDKNYHLAKEEFMAFEVPDVRRSRIVAKNVFPANGGIVHRGGPLLETGGGGGDPAACGAYDPATSSMFCTLVEWARLEREAEGNHNGGSKVTVVYVERDAGAASSLLDFDTFQGGADLRAADGNVDANGRMASLTGARSLIGSCGLGGADIRGPDVKNDGVTVVFSARKSAGESWQLMTVSTSGGACSTLLAEAGVHDFDPAWSPDGDWVVYASTKAGGTSKRLGLPQSDIWRVRADGSGAERMTFLSNSEIGPQFMREGRVSMTTEKVDGKNPTDGFYQLSGRRINWDLTDYHPLLGQRAESQVDPTASSSGVRPSIGFAQATEIREGLDGNFMLIMSDAGAPATAGSLAIFNRSVGPFERGRTDPGFLRSVTIHDPEAGKAFRSPSPLLNGEIMASYGADQDFDLVAVDPQTGAQRPLLSAGRAQLEAVLALSYEPRKLYLNRRQLIFGGAQSPADLSHATVHFPDAPMIATLLGANLRRGRDVAGFRSADRLLLLGADGNMLGSAMLASDGSVRIRAPAATPLYIGIAAGSTTLFTMTEEHQFGPGENISIGVPEALFDKVCAGCHGSVSGREIDIGVSADALTGASESKSRNASPAAVGN